MDSESHGIGRFMGHFDDKSDNGAIGRLTTVFHQSFSVCCSRKLRESTLKDTVDPNEFNIEYRIVRGICFTIFTIVGCLVLVFLVGTYLNPDLILNNSTYNIELVYHCKCHCIECEI